MLVIVLNVCGLKLYHIISLIHGVPLQHHYKYRLQGVPHHIKSYRLQGRCPISLQITWCPISLQISWCPISLQISRCPTSLQITGCPISLQITRCPTSLQITGCPISFQITRCPTSNRA